MKAVIAVIVLSALILSGCHTMETVVVTQKEYISVGVAEHMTRREEIAEFPVSKEEYLKTSPKDKEIILSKHTMALTSVIHILNNRLKSIADLVATQKQLISEENVRAKEEADEQAKRK